MSTKKVIRLDVETTSADENKCGLIQLAGKILIDGKVVETFNFKCKPFADSEIDLEGLKFIRVTPEMIKEYESPLETHKKFIAILGKYVGKYDKKDKFVIKAYNAKFDETVLRRWFKNCGDDYFGSWFWTPASCIMQLAMYVLAPRRHMLENFKQVTVAKFLDIEVDESKAHDAEYDIGLATSIEVELNKQIRAAHDLDKDFMLTL